MIKQRKNVWGPGTIYPTFEQYWLVEVLAEMLIRREDDERSKQNPRYS